MKDKPHDKPVDPRRLDLRSLARHAGALEGRLAQSACTRLAQSVEGAGAAADIAWSARGESRRVHGGEPQVWLHVAAQARVGLVCQRCLQTFETPLDVTRSFLFVDDEAEATRLDEELEDDVLLLPRWLNLLELVEDELILALPIVPRHEVCLQPLPQAGDMLVSAPDELRQNPFAALAALKKPPRPN